MNKSKGVGFLGLLQIVFIVLKLLKVVSWNWFIVLLPIELYALLIIGIVGFYAWIFKK